MDYGKLSKQELIELCEESNIHYSSNITKAELERHLINNNVKSDDYKQDDSNETPTWEQDEEEYTSYEEENQSYLTNDSVGKAGAVLNIIGSLFFVILGFVFILFFVISIPMLIGSIFSIICNIQFLSGKDNKVEAGVLGLLFSGLLGGILVLVSQRETVNK